jgi:hypothetical protein
MQRNALGVYFSSYPTNHGAGVYAVIDNNHAVVTVISGSRGFGKHSAMVLELFENGVPKCYMVELTTNDKGVISIAKSIAQIIPNNAPIIPMGIPKGGDLALLAGTHHHSYAITGVQAAAFLAAVVNFKQKVQNGRYAYVAPGGAIGWMLTRPGKRGVNCTDFAIKMLRAVGITNIKSLVVNTPYRLAK